MRRAPALDRASAQVAATLAGMSYVALLLSGRSEA